jgi:3-deoxy-D-manno-octulosonic-acid transferase
MFPSPMYLIYSALLAAALLVTLPYWLLQSLRHGKYRAGLGERLGRIPQRLIVKPARPVIWVHAVSVGEVLAISGLVGKLTKRFSQHRIVISTTTDTGQRLARSRFGAENVFYFPLDFGFAIRPYLRLLSPELIVIAETEFWPNFLRLAHARGASIAIVNARISDRSWPGYRRFRRLLAAVLRHVDLFLTQTEEDARRLKQIGADAKHVHVTGNLKFDVPAPIAPPIIGSLRGAFQQANAGPVIVCGSTVEGEEPLLLQAFVNVLASHSRGVLILAPRHPERFGEVAELLDNLGIRFWRRSLWNGDPIFGGVLLIDTIGELAALYALGDIAFVGGSLVPRGGHNIIEPALHGIPIIVGSHTENFRDIVTLFQSRDAVRVVGPAELPLAFMELISNPAERIALGRRAAETLRAQMGATQRTMQALEALLVPTAERVGTVLSDVQGTRPAGDKPSAQAQ